MKLVYKRFDSCTGDVRAMLPSLIESALLNIQFKINQCCDNMETLQGSAANPRLPGRPTNCGKKMKRIKRNPNG